MPWRESDRMSERAKFLLRLQAGERMTDLCAEYGISRKTGYKLKARYEEEGWKSLADRSRRPHFSPNRTPQALTEQILGLRRKHPTWGPKKLKARLEALAPEVRWPSASTIGVLLADAGLTKRRQRRRHAWPTPPSERRSSQGPNDLWSMDFKGQFRMGNRRYCHPLTLCDHHSRYVLGCDALEGTRGEPASRALEAVFREYGLPERMRSDNGSPFASTGLGGLTTMSAWLLRLGIQLERIDPGCPQQNGRHERMHLTLKKEATRPAARNLLQQQEKLDRFRRTYNEVRPHEALGMKTPAAVYRPSTRRLPASLPEPDYALHDVVAHVTQAGVVHFRKRAYYVSRALRGQPVGLRQLDERCWLLSFMTYDLGYLDTEAHSLVPLPSDHVS